MNLLNIRVNHDIIDAHFLLHLLKKETSRSWFRIIAKPAVNQASISTTEVGMFQFMMPNMAEQQKIASYLDALDRLITLHQRKPVYGNKNGIITRKQRKVTELAKIYIGSVTTMTAHDTDHGTLWIRNSDRNNSRFEFGKEEGEQKR